mmetsp:Transcript_15411/g.36660  ORF Transcript_15411/g.36660 Transcript_15411/m.36660 type:complete len:103 (-) Transcript_15411:68-376(-)
MIASKTCQRERPAQYAHNNSKPPHAHVCLPSPSLSPDSLLFFPDRCVPALRLVSHHHLHTAIGGWLGASADATPGGTHTRTQHGTATIQHDIRHTTTDECTY